MNDLAWNPLTSIVANLSEFPTGNNTHPTYYTRRIHTNRPRPTLINLPQTASPTIEKKHSAKT